MTEREVKGQEGNATQGLVQSFEQGELIVNGKLKIQVWTQTHWEPIEPIELHTSPILMNSTPLTDHLLNWLIA